MDDDKERLSAFEDLGQRLLESFSPFISAWEVEHPSIDGEALYAELRALVEDE